MFPVDTLEDDDWTDEPLELVFKAGGGVELREPTDNEHIDAILWASDSDADFMDAFPHELLRSQEDAEKVMAYLIEKGELTDDEADNLEIFDESVGPGDPGDNDGEDEDD
jgi:hypothetical protein